MRTIYLDYNATTPIAPAVQEAMLPFLAEHYGNPSSDHVLGRCTRQAIEDARVRVAKLLNCHSDEIIFTSGGTESNNIAITGSAWQHAPQGQGHLIISPFEHPATLQPARFLEKMGYRVTLVPCDSQGTIDPQTVQDAICDDTFLVSIMHANNEIGTVQPISEIGKLCRERNILMHTDAAQSTAKIPTDVNQLNVDFLSIAGHKIYGPKGVGALYIKRGTTVAPVLRGAAHEQDIRPGTENTPYIVALGVAAEQAINHREEAAIRLASLRDRLLSRLRENIPKQLVVNAEQALRLPNTLSVNLPGINAGKLLQKTSELCASTGSACHSGTTSMSSTLAAIGLDPLTAEGTLRLSVGWYTSEEEVDRAADLIAESWANLRRK